MPSRVAGKPSFILKNTTTDRFLLLTEPEKFLAADGRADVAAGDRHGVRLRYGAFDFDIIPALMRKLRAQLLTLTPTSRLRQALARNRRRPVVKAIESGLTALERINISSRNVHGCSAPSIAGAATCSSRRPASSPASSGGRPGGRRSWRQEAT